MTGTTAQAQAAGSSRAGDERLRVLHVLPDLQVGGGQMVVLQLIRAMDQNGFAPAVAFLDSPDDMAGDFAAAGAPPVPLERRDGPPWRTVARLVRVIREQSVDVVHVHSDPDRKYGQLAALLTGRPVVGHLHSRWNHRGCLAEPGAGRVARLSSRTKGALRDWLERRTVRAYLAVGETVRRTHEPLSHVRIVEAPNGVAVEVMAPCSPTEREELRASLGLRPDEPVLICVGRLAFGKGHDALISMLTALPGVLLLVGEGPERERLTSRVECLGLAERVRFLGQRSDVRELLSISDVFVLASVSEGLPVSVVEAMAMGTPVVAFDIPGMSDVVKHGVTGLLVPPGDELAFAAATRELLADKQTRSEMGDAARTVVAQRFDLAATARLVERVYLEVVGDGGRKKGS